MILSVTPNPCVDKTVFIDELKIGTFMRSERFACVTGGKGCNVARAAHVMGRAARALVIVGGHTGAHAVEMLERGDGVPTTPVWVESPTRTITTVLEELVHRQTAFFEPGSRVTPQEYARIVEVFQETVAGAKVVTFNGTVSDKGIQRLYRELIPIAKAAGALTILDAHGPEFALGLEATPYMVKPNAAEAAEFLGYALDDREARLKALDALHARGATLVVLSLGAEGALVSGEGRRFHAVPPAIHEVNPVGSGDCFVAGWAIGLMEGMPLEETAHLACAMGAANASTWDIGHFDPVEVARLRTQVELRPL